MNIEFSLVIRFGWRRKEEPLGVGNYKEQSEEMEENRLSHQNPQNASGRGCWNTGSQDHIPKSFLV